MTASSVRLFVEHPLAPGQAIPLTEAQAGYLFSVMRLGGGDTLTLFNGRDGAWTAQVADAGKRRGVLVPVVQTAPQEAPPDLWLVFAPLRKERTQMLVEKAVELGVGRLVPVLTDRTQGDRFRADKAQAHAVEAAEQCGATSVPMIDPPQPLSRLLSGWPAGRPLIWADETRGSAPCRPAGWPGAPASILIGPEGGFSPAEQARLRESPDVVPVSLGPRILRAETAAIAALALWHAR